MTRALKTFESAKRKRVATHRLDDPHAKKGLGYLAANDWSRKKFKEKPLKKEKTPE